VRKYLIVARTASDHGYAAAFLAVSAIAAIALITMAILIRPPHTKTAKDKT
jgi:hypothetical protein